MIGAAMLTMIPTLNGWAERWLAAMGAFVWQSTLLVALAALVAWLLRRSSPVVRYWLWQIVAIKLLLMPFWTSYVPLPTWAASRPVEQSATSRPAAGPVEDSDRLMFRTSGVGGSPAAKPPPRPVVLGTVGGGDLASLAAVDLVCGRAVAVGAAGGPTSGGWPGCCGRALPADDELAGLVAELAGQPGLRRVPAVVSVAGDCPLFVCGLWRPRLVLPGRLMASLDRPARRQVILHELAHVKRHDLLWGWPVEIARIVYFFHPLVYWVAYQIRLERELACDQLAMAHSGHPPADYAQTLVQVVSEGSGFGVQGFGGTSAEKS